MREAFSAVLLVLGAAFMVLAGLGVCRMPDLFLRLQTTAKASTLALGLLLGSAAVALGEVSVAARVLLGIAFIFAIVPVATQLIARAAFRAGVPLWERLRQNDLEAQRPKGGPREPQLGALDED